MSLVDPKIVNISLLPCLTLEEKDSLPFCPAIYFVVAADAYEVIYIGCSKSLWKRWYQHSHRHRFAQIDNLLIYWYQLLDNDHLYEIEKLFIAYWNPVFNQLSDATSAWRSRYQGFVHVTIDLPQDLLDWADERYPRRLTPLVNILLKREKERLEHIPLQLTLPWSE